MTFVFLQCSLCSLLQMTFTVTSMLSISRYATKAAGATPCICYNYFYLAEFNSCVVSKKVSLVNSAQKGIPRRHTFPCLALKSPPDNRRSTTESGAD
jgi:hypothetical protein